MVKVIFATIACALAVAAPASPGSSATRPAIGATDLRPLTIHGVRFVPGERVHVVLAGHPDATRRATADAAGSFTVRFDVSIGRCGRFAVFAFGSKRSRASLLPTRAQPDCVPPD